MKRKKISELKDSELLREFENAIRISHYDPNGPCDDEDRYEIEDLRHEVEDRMAEGRESKE